MTDTTARRGHRASVDKRTPVGKAAEAGARWARTDEAAGAILQRVREWERLKRPPIAEVTRDGVAGGPCPSLFAALVDVLELPPGVHTIKVDELVRSFIDAGLATGVDLPPG